MTETDFAEQLDSFAAHYRYDVTYMRELLEYSPQGYAKFAAFLPLADHRERLSLEMFWTSKLAAMQMQDCGECLQLCIRKALEQGVERDLIRQVLSDSDQLSPALRDLLLFSRTVADNRTPDTELAGRLEARFDKGELLELGLSIAATLVFPAIKRTLGYAKSCRVLELEI